MELADPERAKRIWILLEATDWKWPPDVLERQDDALMDDIIKIAGAAQIVRKQLEENEGSETDND